MVRIKRRYNVTWLLNQLEMRKCMLHTNFKIFNKFSKIYLAYQKQINIYKLNWNIFNTCNMLYLWFCRLCLLLYMWSISWRKNHKTWSSKWKLDKFSFLIIPYYVNYLIRYYLILLFSYWETIMDYQDYLSLVFIVELWAQFHLDLILWQQFFCMISYTHFIDIIKKVN